MDDAHEIVAHYEQDYDESRRITAGLNQLELIRTREVIRRHLPAGPGRVLDVGGGTGVHARWLAEDGHDVHLVDLTPLHVEAARGLAAEGLSVTAEVGDARRLDVADASFDAVLLLGPLYHLPERADRVQALREAARVVRPGGLVFVAAISRFASLFDGLARGAIFEPEFRRVVDRDLTDGRHRNPQRHPGWFTTAYFHRPDDLAGEAADGGLRVLELIGVEGLAGWLAHLDERWRGDAAAQEVVLASARTTEAEPSLRGLSAHMVLVAARPDDDDGSYVVEAGGHWPDDVDRLLRALPEWFGRPDSNATYVEAARTLANVVARKDGEIVGVCLLRQHNPLAAEVELLAVTPSLHRSGIGRGLVERAAADARAAGSRLLQVKTFGPSGNSEPYERTRAFYAAIGFVPLEERTDIWGEDNPCLISVMTLL